MTTDGPRKLDLSKASAARLYDYYLGGDHNYAVDRQFAAIAFQTCPFLPSIAQLNRGFLRRAVQCMANRGIKQFLDIGSGVPTVDNVHQVAHEIDPNIRVVYVDNDDEAIVTSLQLLENEPNAVAFYGDLRQPESIIDAPEVRSFLDFSKPIGLLSVAVYHFISPEEQPQELAGRYRDALASGSYFAASHVSTTEMTETAAGQLMALEAQYGSSSNPATVRTKEEFTTLFAGWEIIEPGVTFAGNWPEVDPAHDDDPALPSMYAAVGRKP